MFDPSPEVPELRSLEPLDPPDPPTFPLDDPPLESPMPPEPPEPPEPPLEDPPLLPPRPPPVLLLPASLLPPNPPPLELLPLSELPPNPPPLLLPDSPKLLPLPPELPEPLPLRLPLWLDPGLVWESGSLMLLSFSAMVILLRWALVNACRMPGDCRSPLEAMEDCVLYRTPIFQVLDDDFLQQVRGHVRVPDSFGIHNDDRTIAAHSETGSLASLYAIGAEKQIFTLQQLGES